MNQRKTIFGQHKKYDLFLKIVFYEIFLENNSISQLDMAKQVKIFWLDSKNI